ncbi:hypothetical protein Tco_0335142 [Tanacetum coccineum]
MADKGKKSSMETFVPNDKAYYYSRITSITVYGKNAYELKGKFLDDLHNNSFSGTNGKDAVFDDESSDHEEYWSDKEEETVQNLKIWNTDITRRLGIYDWDENVPGFMIAVASIMEYEKSQNQSNTIANLLIIRLDVRNGQPVVGEWIVIVWRKNCALGAYHIEYTLLLPRPSNGPRERNIDEYWWKIYKSGDLEVLES